MQSQRNLDLPLKDAPESFKRFLQGTTWGIHALKRENFCLDECKTLGEVLNQISLCILSKYIGRQGEDWRTCRWLGNIAHQLRNTGDVEFEYGVPSRLYVKKNNIEFVSRDNLAKYHNYYDMEQFMRNKLSANFVTIEGDICYPVADYEDWLNEVMDYFERKDIRE